MKTFLHDWQSIIGAIIGSSIPIIFWFFIKWYEKCDVRKENLYYIDKFLVLSINAIGSDYESVNNFINKQLSDLIKDIKNSIDKKEYSLHSAFFPLFASKPTEIDLLKLNSGSGYIDNKITQIIKMSKDFDMAMQDIRGQFSYTLNLNREMAINKVNDPVSQGNGFLYNMQSFTGVLKEDLLENNFKNYLRILVETRVALNFRQKNGLFLWRLIFSPSFKFFVNRKKFNHFKSNGFERVELYFKDKSEKEFKKISSQLI